MKSRSALLPILLGILLLICGNAAAEIGNVDGLGDIDLEDAILSLQINVGISTPSPVETEADVDGDGKIGLAEAVYALQVVADVREAVREWFKDADNDGVSDGTMLVSVERPSSVYFAATELYAVSGDTNDSDPNIRPEVPSEIDMVLSGISENALDWTASINPVSSLPTQDRQQLLGAILPDPANRSNLRALPPGRRPRSLPPNFDWRNQNGNNYVTNIKDQGGCGSCWAFAGVAALESQILISLGDDEDLSEQIAVSCSSAGDCGGGTLSGVSNFLRDTGTPVESCYPYNATNGSCENACPNWPSGTLQIDSWSYVVWGETPTVETIKNALYNNGPLLSAFLVYTDFFSYDSGVYEYSWGRYEGGHAILIVGWDDSTSSFIVKNSWSEFWGESGYFNIAYSELSGNSEFGRYTIAYQIDPSDPGELQFDAVEYAILESDSFATITVSRTGGDFGTVSVNYATTGGTAAPGADYTSTSGTLTFADGVATRSFSVPISDDAIVEGTETITLSLSNPTGGGSLGGQSSSTITILDDDVPQVGQFQFTSPSYAVDEGEGPIMITVTRTNGSDGVAAVSYSTGNGTAVAGQDYFSASGTLNFSDGETSKTFSISIIDDVVVEASESVNLALSSPTNGATIGGLPSAVLTIADDDIPAPGQVQFSSASYSINEAGSSVSITVIRTGGSDGAVSVTCATSDGSAAAGLDYSAVSTTVTFLDGDTTPKTFSVGITDDSTAEGNETVNLSLSNPSGGATLGAQSTSVLTISDDDTPSTVDLYLQNEIVTTTETYTTSNSIWAGKEVTTQKPYGDYVILSGGNVTLNSGTIHLKPGFTASEGSSFRATAQ